MRAEEAEVGTAGIMGVEPEGTGGAADGSGQTKATGGGAEEGRTEATGGGAEERDPLDDPASLEADARAERVDRVAVLYARITAATREFLAAVAECDRHQDWAAEGFGSCAEWLAWRVGLGRNAANERVRVARALERLPKTSEAMGRGEISFSKVRAITRVATEDCEAELLELARAGSAAYLERVVRAWKTLCRDDEVARERMLHRTRRFSVVPDGEGMYEVRSRLTPEVAAVLMRAVDAAGDALYAGSSEDEREETEPAQRRADAVGLLAERALAAGFGGAMEGSGDMGVGGSNATDDIPVSGSRAERYQVVLHVEPETLAEDGEPGMSELEDGTRVSAETARRLACDASVVEVTRSRGEDTSRQITHGDRSDDGRSDDGRSDGGRSGGGRSGGGRSDDHGCSKHRPGHESEQASLRPPARETGRSSILDVGRRTRTVPPAVRRALEVRDRGCRFPGCGSRFTDAHHIVHWADGGETKLNNLVLLCRRHHRRVHEEGWRVCSDATGDAIVFFTPQGKALAAAPPMSAVSPTDQAMSAVSPTDQAMGARPSMATRPRTAAKPLAATKPSTAAKPLTATRPDRSEAGSSTPTPTPLERLTRALAERGVDPDWRTNLPAHRYDHDVPWAIEAAAREALEDSAELEETVAGEVST